MSDSDKRKLRRVKRLLREFKVYVEEIKADSDEEPLSHHYEDLLRDIEGAIA